MPGPIVHLIVQQRLASALREVGGASGAELATLLNKDACSPYAAFGSMGPDYLFFSLKEYGTPLDEFANFLFEVYDALEPLIEFYEEHIEPVVDAIEDAIAAVDEILFQGLFGQIKDTADLLGTTALTAVAKVLTDNVDLFYPFYPKVQEGAAETDWYWFDFLHYRRTGQFGSTMWRLANSANDDDLRRYCLGYASHIGTDVVGHPFVNAIVGGPYRTHWHRHKLVENWIDAYARSYYPDAKSLIKCLNLTADDTYLANNIAGSYYSRLCEFSGAKLPTKLGEMIARAMRDTYGGDPHPVFLSAADLDTTYRLWLKWFERSTSIGSAVKPTPVPPPGSAVSSLVSDYVSGFPSFPGGGGSPGGGGGFSIWNLFAAIAAFVKWLFDSLLYTLEWIITHAIDIVTLPLTEALNLLKWLLYQVQKGIYEIYDNLRFALVLGGYLFPEQGDLAKDPWGKALLNTAHVHLTGGTAANFNLYPRKQESHGLGGPMEHHLIYQSTLQEKEHAEPMPKPFHGQWPETFIANWHAYNPFIDNLYACTQPYGTNFKATHEVDKASWNTPQLGSALQFSARLIGQRIDDLPNFNLDGDRGYGWKTWRVAGLDPTTPDAAQHLEKSNPVEVEYIHS